MGPEAPGTVADTDESTLAPSPGTKRRRSQGFRNGIRGLALVPVIGSLVGIQVATSWSGRRTPRLTTSRRKGPESRGRDLALSLVSRRCFLAEVPQCVPCVCVCRVPGRWDVARLRERTIRSSKGVAGPKGVRSNRSLAACHQNKHTLRSKVYKRTHTHTHTVLRQTGGRWVVDFAGSRGDM